MLRRPHGMDIHQRHQSAGGARVTENDGLTKGVLDLDSIWVAGKERARAGISNLAASAAALGRVLLRRYLRP